MLSWGIERKKTKKRSDVVLGKREGDKEKSGKKKRRIPF